jgi:hypothetical protein
MSPTQAAPGPGVADACGISAALRAGGVKGAEQAQCAAPSYPVVIRLTAEQMALVHVAKCSGYPIVFESDEAVPFDGGQPSSNPRTIRNRLRSLRKAAVRDRREDEA